MKRLFTIAILACLLYSCTKEEIAPYDLSRDNIYLNFKNTDSLVYSFAYHPDLERDTIWLPIIISGKATDHNREFAINVIDTLTSAVKDLHYEALKASYTMPADSGTLRIPIVLLNTDTALANKSVDLTIQVSGGKDFSSNLPYGIRTKRILFSSRLEEPAWWSSWPQMGKYTRVKHQLFLISSGTTDMVIQGSYPDWYMEIPRSLYYIANTSYLLNYPFEWVKEHPESGYVLEKRNDSTGDYDFYSKSAPTKRFWLKYFPTANKYVFIDENGGQVLF
ncbi:protein of unknown function [Chitinophaga jiangningensis]|uniref:DUF4843 domain-containing protein n=1 Tax=Chitinophaga jiangningensis TaxID=1419482 RepID=A0A1M7MVP9_9BACT|nr:DUF4843 domain-containing protein [Chitinophaga jiangningensis]SHM95223.1 protein of unknown function [Chitinophaga jiangningensis]